MHLIIQYTKSKSNTKKIVGDVAKNRKQGGGKIQD